MQGQPLTGHFILFLNAFALFLTVENLVFQNSYDIFAVRF
jgi:hypothetical protein